MNSDDYGRGHERIFDRVDQGYFISKHDWELLQQKSEVDRERGYRNLFLGIAGSGVLGTLSTIAANFSQLSTRAMGPTESALLVLVSSATFSASVLTVFFQHRVKTNGSDKAMRILNDTQLEQPQAADDPRQWP